MTYFLYQTALITTLAIFAGAVIGWWLHFYYGKDQREVAKNEFSLVKDYLAESIKENARLKLKLKLSQEKIDILSNNENPVIHGVDFDAYQVFEETVKEAQMRKYLN
ncbi:MAG: hypothetical protein V3V19_10740 [Cocleimonas sp.]